MHRAIYNILLPRTGWHLIPFPPPQRVYGRTLRHNQIFLPMVPRWRASRAGALLLNDICLVVNANTQVTEWHVGDQLEQAI